MFTFQDAIDHLVDYLGGTPSDTVQRDCRRAIVEAYRDLGNAFRWTYLFTTGRVATVAPFRDGTVAYAATTGRLTLTGATWPAWSYGAYVRVGFVAGRVAARVSDTVLQLDPVVTFPADLDAGTYYTLYRDSYLLPADFIAGDQALSEGNFGGMTWIHPREWVFEERFVFAQGTPQAYTVTGDQLYPGRLLLRLCPTPIDQRTIDFLYHRRPRALSLALAAGGTVSVGEGFNSVVGVGTPFNPGMVGSVVRFSGTAAVPTSVFGKNPGVWESTVTSVADATHLVVAGQAPEGLIGVGYTVSDPIDLEEGSMLNAFLRCCEMHISMNRTLKDKPSARQQYLADLGEARAADSRTFAGRAVGDMGCRPAQRLRDMPITFNQ